MKIINCVQGTKEWHDCRCGIPTASNFNCIVTSEGKRSKQREKYLYRLAAESVSGIVEDTFQNGDMLRGKELEAKARELYQFLNNVKIKQVGFCVTEGSYIYGASPDGLVNSQGMFEAKCPKAETHVTYLVENRLPVEYVPQVQGQLLVAERKWVDFMSYYPELKPFIIRVSRDKKFLSKLEAELNLFCKDLKQIVKKIKGDK